MGNCPPQKLHERASKLVKASAQGRDDRKSDAGIERRGNHDIQTRTQCKVLHKSKNATVADYRKATGLEALMGYLYLKRGYETYHRADKDRS